MTLESALTFFIATVFFAISPGPGVFAIISTALINGVRASLPMIFGVLVSDCIYLLLACYGMALIAETWSLAFTIIRYLGAVYLIYLGWKMWTTAVYIEKNPLIKGQSLSRFLQGFWISASNPKVILFYLTLLPLLVDLTTLNAFGFFTAAILTASGLLLGLSFVAYSAASMRGFFQTDSSLRYLNKTSGAVMIGAGVYLGLDKR